jgi:hypothetical protein
MTGPDQGLWTMARACSPHSLPHDDMRSIGGKRASIGAGLSGYVRKRPAAPTGARLTCTLLFPKRQRGQLIRYGRR